MGVFRFVRFGDEAKKTQKNMEKYEILISKKNDHGFFLAVFGTTVIYPVYIIHPCYTPSWIVELIPPLVCIRSQLGSQQGSHIIYSRLLTKTIILKLNDTGGNIIYE